MSEKLYEFLLRLYPEHFRRTYGDEALRLVRDRARSEKGFLSGLRLWLDLLLDLAKSLPSRIQQPANNGNHSGTSPTMAKVRFSFWPTIVEPDSSVRGRYVIGGVVLGMRLYSCAQRGIPGIISGSALVARAGAERSGPGSVSLRRRIACSKFSHHFCGRWRSRAFRTGRRVQLLHDRATGHSEQLSTATLCVSLCASRRVRGRTNRWKSREDIQERTASLDSCACVRWRSPVRLASG